MEFAGTKLLLVCYCYKLVLFSRVLNGYSFQVLFLSFDLVWLFCVNYKSSFGLG